MIVILFYASFAICFYFSATQHNIHTEFHSPWFLLSFSSLCSTWYSTYAWWGYSWLDRIGWWFDSLHLLFLMNASLGSCFLVTNIFLRRIWPSLRPLHSALSSKDCWLEMFMKGCGLDERCRAESSGGLPRSLYLWPLILNICTYMTTLFSAVLTLQKIAICLQVCLVLGHCHHQNDCCDDVLGDLLMAFQQGS